MTKVAVGTTDEASVRIEAAPQAVYALVSDITRMGEWSPETRKCAWIDGATEATVGARFKAYNKARKGPGWSNKPTVVAAEPGREFAFSRRSGPGAGEVVWRYRMQPSGGSTELIESYEVTKPISAFMSWLTNKMTRTRDRGADLKQGMSVTLGRIKAAAEAK